MRKNCKRFLSWIMLLLLTYNNVGYLFIFSFAESANRIEIQKRFMQGNESNLVLLTILKDDSFIRKSNDEIIVNGKLYDVKKEFTKNGSTYFFCLNDYKEEQLNKQLADNVQSGTGSATQNSNSTKFCSKNIITEFTLPESISFLSATEICLHFSFIAKHSPEGADKINHPPPNSLVIDFSGEV